jgi:hypothetical protein
MTTDPQGFAMKQSIRWFRAWPPTHRENLLRHMVPGGGEAAVDVHPDGHLSFTVSRSDGTTVYEGEYQRVTITPESAFMLILQWGPPGASVHFNRKQLGAYQPGQRPVQFEPNPILQQPPSFLRSDAATVCQGWIRCRKAKFAVPTIRAGRRRKTVIEEARDLRRSVTSLQQLIKDMGQQRRFDLARYVAGELRALVYWVHDQQRDRAYNPLLLRMASKADLPLPVFANSDPLSLPPSVPRPVFHFSNHVSFREDFPGMTLMDLQTWLKAEVVVLHTSGTGSVGTDLRLSAKEVIAEIANAEGVSHYDEDISEVTEAIRGLTFGRMDAIIHFLGQTADVVNQLGFFVLDRLVHEGIISAEELASENRA